MLKIPSMSSKKLTKLLEKGGAVFIRQGKTDHAIYSKTIEGKRYSAPVQMGKKTLDPVYCSPCVIKSRYRKEYNKSRKKYFLKNNLS